MQALGFDTYRYKLVCFAIGGAGSALAGALLANKNTFVSPGLLDWLQSGTLLVWLSSAASVICGWLAGRGGVSAC